jgi:hypothetical protein
MSYINANTIDEIRQRSYFIEMTPTGLRESHAHGVSARGL